MPFLKSSLFTALALLTAGSAFATETSMVMTARETPEEACAKKNDAAACTVAALRAVTAAKTDEKAAADARAFFEKGCELGDAESCRYLGSLLKDGETFKADLKAAQTLLTRACDLKDARACRAVVDILEEAHDEAGMITFLGKACDLKDETSCLRAATLDKSADNIKWTEAACELGRMDACLDAASRYAKGEDAPKNLDRAIKNYKAACNLSNAPSCFRAGTMLRDGEGVTKNLADAVELFDKACQMRQTRACALLGDIYLEKNGIGPDEKKSKFYHEIACASGLRSSCPKAGR